MWTIHRKLTSALAALILAAPAMMPQSRPAEEKPPAKPAETEGQLRSTYVLGPEDLIIIRALEAEEITEKPVRIDMSGYIRLPLAGRVHAAGLTVEQLEAELTTQLKTYLKHPQVAVTITEFRSQPVSIMGAVNTPGVHQLQGRKTLVEILSLAGGVQPDAGHSIKITRHLEWGRIPLPNATDDPTGQFSVGEVSLKAITEAKNPAENILIRPNDVISVPRAETIYVIGEVRKPGGFMLRARESVSVLQALSLAEGLARTAGPKNAKILRTAPGGSQRTEIPIDLSKVLAGKATDVALQPEDILFVPNNTPKNVAVRSLETMLGMGTAIGTGMIIYRR